MIIRIQDWCSRKLCIKQMVGVAGAIAPAICFMHILLLHQANALPVSLWSFFGSCISRQCLFKLGIESAFNQWWPFWVRICTITRQFTWSVRPCSVGYKNVDRRLQMLDKDYKIPDHGKPSIFVGERQSSALVLLKKSLRSRVINESLHKLRGLVNQLRFTWNKMQKKCKISGNMMVCNSWEYIM